MRLMVKCSSRQDHVVGCQGLSVDVDGRTWRLRVPGCDGPEWTNGTWVIGRTTSIARDDKYAIVDDTDDAHRLIASGRLILLGEVCD